MLNKLERIQVSGFKSIRELDIELRDLNVLIGANGSGKSNFISLFRLLNEILEQRLQRYSQTVGVDNLLYYGRKNTTEISIKLTFLELENTLRNQYQINLATTDSDKLLITNEYFYEQTLGSESWGQALSDGVYKESKLYSALDSSQEDEISRLMTLIASLKIYHVHDTSSDSPLKRSGYIHENERLKPDASNLAAYLYLLQEKYTNHYQKIVRTIRRIAPFFDDFVLRPDPLNEENIRLQWRDVNSADNIFSAHTLSDGTLRFMALTTLLLQPDDRLPSLILIDEPELGLHPFAINILVALLQSAATKTQVIISTQSVPLINQFAPEDIIVVDRQDKQSTFERLETEDLKAWMTEYSGYGIGDLWEKNIIGGRPQREAL